MSAYLRHSTREVLTGGMLLFLLSAFCHVVQADEVRLISGLTIQGKITHEDEEHVVIQTEIGRASFPRDRVAAIEREPLDLPVPKEILVNIPWEQLRDRLRMVQDRLGAVQSRLMETYFNLDALGGPVPQKADADSDGARTVQKLPDGVTPAAESSVASGLPAAGLLLGFCLILYAYAALCLQRLAAYARLQHRWMAWVPPFQLFLWMRLAGRSVLWLLAPFGLAFIDPRAAQLAWLCLGLAIANGVAQQFGRSGWFGLLLCVPGLNLIALGYLAFSLER